MTATMAGPGRIDTSWPARDSAIYANDVALYVFAHPDCDQVDRLIAMQSLRWAQQKSREEMWAHDARTVRASDPVPPTQAADDAWTLADAAELLDEAAGMIDEVCPRLRDAATRENLTQVATVLRAWAAEGGGLR